MKEITGYKCERGENFVVFTPIIKSNEPKEVVKAFEIANTVKLNVMLWQGLMQAITIELNYEKFLTDYFTILDEFKKIKAEFQNLMEERREK